MENVKNVIDEYISGDFEKRLNLFLTHRSLRNEFDCIERGEKIISQCCECFNLQEAA